MNEDINNNIRKSNFYIHYRELLQEIKDSYESPEEYNINKLNDEDCDKIVLELYNDDFFNNVIDKYVQETLERYAAIKENQESLEQERSS